MSYIAAKCQLTCVLTAAVYTLIHLHACGCCIVTIRQFTKSNVVIFFLIS